MITDLLARAIAVPKSLWLRLARRQNAEELLDDEIRAYVDGLAEEYVRNGMTPAEARRAALVETGGIEQVKEATRDAWIGDWLVSTVREFRYAARTLQRAPAFLVVAVVTLGLGIGGATAVFTVIKGSLLRPLPAAAEPERLVAIERTEKNAPAGEVSGPDFQELRTQATTLSGIAGFEGGSIELENATGRSQQWVSYVTDQFFSVMGVHPAAGRFFATDAGGTNTETAPVVVLGYELWQRRFNASQDAIGSLVKLNGSAYTIIGVAPPRFIGAMATHPMELFVLLAPGGHSVLGGIDLNSRRVNWLRLVGRLAPGRSVADAQREVELIASRLATAYPETNSARSMRVLPRTGMLAVERRELSRVPTMLTGAVVLLLVIACGNVAGLSLVRAAARRRELATRLALGASRGALMRQVAIEGALVALGAGILGVFVAKLLVGAETLVRTVVDMNDMDLRLDLRVLAVAVAASTITAILVSLLPAFQILKIAPGAVLKDGGRAGIRSLGGQRLLVMAQVSASLVLLSASVITFTAFRRVLGAHDRFEPVALSDFRINVERATPDTAVQLAILKEVLEQATAHPSINGAALATTIPPFQYGSMMLVFREGDEPPAGSSDEQRASTGVRVNAVRVSTSFFDVMRIPVQAGRQFASTDTRSTEPSVIVNRRTAEVLWPGKDPLGRIVTWNSASGPRKPPLRVIGVVEDTRDASLAELPPLSIYLPVNQQPRANINLIVRGRNGVPVPIEVVQRLVETINPAATVTGGRTLIHRLQEHVRPQRTASAWVGVFAGIALLLAAIGLYGVVAQSLLQRTRELAVRSALGASPRRLMNGVIAGELRLAVVGVATGAFVSLAGRRVLRSLFAGVERGDVWPIVFAVVVMTAAMLVAAWIPARRAATADPVLALRAD